MTKEGKQMWGRRLNPSLQHEQVSEERAQGKRVSEYGKSWGQ